MKKILSSVFLLLFTVAVIPAFADEEPMHSGSRAAMKSSGDYKENMKHSLVRGLKNIVGAPLEIPITIQEYHEREGRPVIRHIAGLIDGSFQMLVRFGSGAWDLVAAFIPEHQEGMPVDPETLF